MRRKDKEIIEKKEIQQILEKAEICRIAFAENGIPYIVPLNFAYKDNKILLHSAKEGKKIDIINTNINVCFEVEIDTELVKSDNPCDWGMRYKTVIGNGKATILENSEDKIKILQIITEKYTDESDYTFTANSVKNLAIISIDITDMKGKISGY